MENKLAVAISDGVLLIPHGMRLLLHHCPSRAVLIEKGHHTLIKADYPAGDEDFGVVSIHFLYHLPDPPKPVLVHRQRLVAEGEGFVDILEPFPDMSSPRYGGFQYHVLVVNAKKSSLLYPGLS
jgi:hypothetical protein